VSAADGPDGALGGGKVVILAERPVHVGNADQPGLALITTIPVTLCLRRRAR
jgi:hypothetical protein